MQAWRASRRRPVSGTTSAGGDAGSGTAFSYVTAVSAANDFVGQPGTREMQKPLAMGRRSSLTQAQGGTILEAAFLGGTMKRTSRAPSKLSESVHHQLKMYALAAGAAGVSAIALAPPAPRQDHLHQDEHSNSGEQTLLSRREPRRHARLHDFILGRGACVLLMKVG